MTHPKNQEKNIYKEEKWNNLLNGTVNVLLYNIYENKNKFQIVMFI